ncbi:MULTISPECIES: RNA polymerase factor sigma-54 [Rhizobium]|uniref:RNA polymerase sigma-54 factor n=2 Tax=Rhizobium TaxID=379 RepID=K0Q522_9HYPH|nr:MULTISPECIES: RNA polymerase factor sigma-54 [Rhizobium]KWV52318.1 RNA polymerase sigma-54 factor [Rhizobium altiplani]CCM80375.1 RNA polymerase sigma-54 factor [Rhizobium mesoamericanum STM3625]
MQYSASLTQRQSQSLVFTPQLIQSIRLLQFAHGELRQFIEQELEKNPFLELAPDSGSCRLPQGSAEPGSLESQGAMSASSDGSTSQSEWKSTRSSPDASAGNSMPSFEEYAAAPETLHENVDRQIALTPFRCDERLIARALADHLDDTGYLHADLREIAAVTNFPESELERILRILQGFDPIGIFARDLRECLEIQLRQRDRLDPAMEALVANLPLLAQRNFRALKHRCDVDEEDLLEMLQEIRSLDPKPGNRYHSGAPEAIIADVRVLPSPAGGWQIELTPELLPRVLLNQSYFAEVSRSRHNSSEQAFLSECFQSANWLVRSLDQRAKTILKVASEIVRQQGAFLEHGVAHLRPLNLRTVAEAIEMHESTVSRVTANKYMLTPRGVFELKYFFTSSIASSEGGEAHSAEAIRHRIKAMIAAEDENSVLSDDEMVAELRRVGIDIARRTVAKYRETMNIPSSFRRLREFKTRSTV